MHNHNHANLAQLITAHNNLINAKKAVEYAAVQARQNGESWQRIADVLGISRQAAEQRYSKLVTKCAHCGRK